MKNNQIMINIELILLQDIIKIIGNAIHPKFSHDEVDNIKRILLNKYQEGIQQDQTNLKLPEQS